MKITMQRRHVVRPSDYESVELTARVEIDPDSDPEIYKGNDITGIGDELSLVMDELLDKDVDRTLRLDGEHIEDTHLWVFYDKD